MEAEIADLDGDDKQAFLTDTGLKRAGTRPRHPRRLHAARAADVLHRRARRKSARGRSEVGDTAPQAAGVIHTDFEKGFIRAEVIAYDDFIGVQGRAGRQGGRQRCASKARSTSSRTATSCTSASTSDLEAPGAPRSCTSAAVLAACADAPRLEMPRIAVDSVRLERMTGAEAHHRRDIEPRQSQRPRDRRRRDRRQRDASRTLPVGSAHAHGAGAAAGQRRGRRQRCRRAPGSPSSCALPRISRSAPGAEGIGRPRRVRYAVSGTATLERRPRSRSRAAANSSVRPSRLPITTQ